MRALALLLALLCSPAWAGDFYLDTAIGTDINPGTAVAPYATVGRHLNNAAVNACTGLNQVGPGDTLYVYATAAKPLSRMFLQLITQTDAGCSNMVFKVVCMPSANGQPAQIYYDGASSNFGIQLSDHVANTIISGCDFVVSPTAQPQKACGQVDGQGASGGGTVTTHHVIFDHVRFFRCGGGGVNFNYGDYFAALDSFCYYTGTETTISSTSCYSWLSPVRTAATTYAWPSEMAALINQRCPIASLASTYPMILCGSVAWGASAGASGSTSDGNGAILDNWGCLNDRNAKDLPYCNPASDGLNHPYAGRMLIAGNIFYKNEGKGVHVYAHVPGTTTDQVMVIGNTFVQNCDRSRGHNVCGSSGGAVNITDAGDVVARCNYMSLNTWEFGISKTKCAGCGGTITPGTVKIGQNDAFGGAGISNVGSGAGAAMTDEGGNVTTDPAFRLNYYFDFHLTGSSPSLSCTWT